LTGGKHVRAGDGPGRGPSDGDPFAGPRRHMIETIEKQYRECAHLIGRDAPDRRVLEAMARVPRHEFVNERDRHRAYGDHALPVAHGQTISQPFIVALMTDLLRVGEDDTVLEIGTGTGYQAAVLAELASQVYTVECVAALAERARERLRALGYRNIEGRVGNGREGWPEHAPYGGVVVTAGGEDVPPALVEQMRPGARLVIPLATVFDGQSLTVIEKGRDGRLSRRSVLGVAFVPLTG